MKKNQMLKFLCSGEWHIVNYKGEMIQENRYLKGETFSEQWLFLGVSFHHWRTNIDLKLEDIKDPKDLIKGLVWDVDHGTTRQWGGSYYGKIPRIVDAYFEEE